MSMTRWRDRATADDVGDEDDLALPNDAIAAADDDDDCGSEGGEDEPGLRRAKMDELGGATKSGGGGRDALSDTNDVCCKTDCDVLMDKTVSAFFPAS